MTILVRLFSTPTEAVEAAEELLDNGVAVEVAVEQVEQV
jgi:hypothetical protein